MNLPLRAFFAIAAATVWLILPGCRKVYDELRQDPDAIGKFCRIDTMSINEATQQMKVTYNHLGDPAIMAPLTTYQIGLTFDSIVFRYDRQDRLVDVVYLYPYFYNPLVGFSSADIDLWNRFTYPAPDIVVDSEFNYDGPGILPVDNPPYGGGNIIVSRYRLDEQGRTIWTDIRYLTAGVVSFTNSFPTSYDRKGNAIVPGAVYDDKINIYRTSKAWQLLFQEYSRNNRMYLPPTGYGYPVSPLSYNKWGLPTVLVATPANQELPFFPFNYGSTEGVIFMDVSYSCDDGGNKLR